MNSVVVYDEGRSVFVALVYHMDDEGDQYVVYSNQGEVLNTVPAPPRQFRRHVTPLLVAPAFGDPHVIQVVHSNDAVEINYMTGEVVRRFVDMPTTDALYRVGRWLVAVGPDGTVSRASYVDPKTWEPVHADAELPACTDAIGTLTKLYWRVGGHVVASSAPDGTGTVPCPPCYPYGGPAGVVPDDQYSVRVAGSHDVAWTTGFASTGTTYLFAGPLSKGRMNVVATLRGMCVMTVGVSEDCKRATVVGINESLKFEFCEVALE
jgi:hypothetical protein